MKFLIHIYGMGVHKRKKHKDRVRKHYNTTLNINYSI